MPRPFTLSYDPARRALAFRSLFPRLAGAIADRGSVCARVVGERSTRRVPAHKRLDGPQGPRPLRRPAAAALSLDHDGHADRNDAYAVSQLLNLVNELFLVLHETYPDYLWPSSASRRSES